MIATIRSFHFLPVKYFPQLIFLQGLILAIFLTVEVALGFFFMLLHIPFYLLAIFLMRVGFLFQQAKPNPA